MSNTPTRLTEFWGLVSNYAFHERSLRFTDFQPTPEQRAEHAAMRARLDDVARLCNMDDESGTQYDVDAAVEKWIEGNPLALTGQGMKRVIDASTGQGNGVSVVVQIGDPAKGGRQYPINAGQFEVSRVGTLVLRLPDSIAEEFRQQGRRQYQREIHRALGL